jgi:hypothetical protein
MCISSRPLVVKCNRCLFFTWQGRAERPEGVSGASVEEADAWPKHRVPLRDGDAVCTGAQCAKWVSHERDL